jgi:4'-phosphopantetheinyl transferase
LRGPTGAGESAGDARLALWWAPLDIPNAALTGLAACLSSEERRRAEHFRGSRDRQRFVAARGWMRHLLASQLSCATSDIAIVTGEHGKPRLACTDLSFSAARSASVALYATSRRMDVGVDIEATRTSTQVDRIAARFMSPAEQRALASLPLAQRRQAVFQWWTCKEAYVKGIGTGLSFPLHTADVWDGSGHRAMASGWAVHQIDIGPRFAAAVAGASISGWAPPVPRSLGAMSMDDSERLPTGCSRAVPMASWG